MRCAVTKRMPYPILNWTVLIRECRTQSNPNVSEAAKQHARDVLDNELGGYQPREQIQKIQGDHNKDPTRVAAGYKA